jgi:hypothetical protein
MVYTGTNLFYINFVIACSIKWHLNSFTCIVNLVLSDRMAPNDNLEFTCMNFLGIQTLKIIFPESIINYT